MSQQQAVKAKHADLSKISFGKLNKNKSNLGSSIYLNYDGGRFILQMPKMLGRGTVFEDDKGTRKYVLSLSFYGEEDYPEVKQAHELLGKIDELCLTTGMENSMEWFKKRKRLTRDGVEAMYKPCLRYNVGKDGKEYADDMRVKVVDSGRGFGCSVFNAEKNASGVHAEITMNVDNFEDVLGRNGPVTALIQCTGLWFSDGKFGLGWKLLQVQVRQPQAQIKNYAFVHDSDDEKESNDNKLATEQENDKENENENDNDIENGDDEESDTVVVPSNIATVQANAPVTQIPAAQTHANAPVLQPANVNVAQPQTVQNTPGLTTQPQKPKGKFKRSGAQLADDA